MLYKKIIFTFLLTSSSAACLFGTQLPDPKHHSIKYIAQWMLAKPIKATRHFLRYYDDQNLQNSIKKYLLTNYMPQSPVLELQAEDRLNLDYQGVYANCAGSGVLNAAVDAQMSHAIIAAGSPASFTSRLWQFSATEKATSVPLPPSVHCTAAAFNPYDNRFAVIANTDYSITYWNMTGAFDNPSQFEVVPNQSYQVHTNEITSLIFCDDYNVYSGGVDRKIFCKNVASDAPPVCIVKDASDQIYYMAYSSQKWLANGGPGSVVRVWDLNGNLINSLDCRKINSHGSYHDDDSSKGITYLTFDPSGTLLYVSFDYKQYWGALVWNLDTGKYHILADDYSTSRTYAGVFMPDDNFVIQFYNCYNIMSWSLTDYTNSTAHSNDYFGFLTYMYASLDGNYVYGMNGYGDIVYWEVVGNNQMNAKLEQISLEELVVTIQNNEI